MNKKKIRIVIVILILSVFGFMLCIQLIPDEYRPADNEIALHIQMDTKEDVGLLVFDYRVDDKEYSGGISNADKSQIGHNSDNIVVWNKQELSTFADSAEFEIYFRIITEYTDPNYENTYPENITRYADAPVSFEAYFGNEYYITITGDKANGYKAALSDKF